MGGLLQEGGKGYVGPLGRLFVGSSKAITQIIGGGGVGAGPPLPTPMYKRRQITHKLNKILTRLSI